MLKKLRLKLIKILFFNKKDISVILSSLGFGEEEYERRYNNPEHAGYKSPYLKSTLKSLERLQDDFGYMLGIENYNTKMSSLKKRYANND